METTTIAGVKVSRIGLGTWAIGGLDWGAIPEEVAIATCLSAVERGIKRSAAWREEVEHGAAVAVLDGGKHELVLVLHVLQVEDHGVADKEGILGQPGLRPDAQHVILEGPGPQCGKTGVDAGRVGVDQRALSKRQQR